MILCGFKIDDQDIQLHFPAFVTSMLCATYLTAPQWQEPGTLSFSVGASAGALAGASVGASVGADMLTGGSSSVVDFVLRIYSISYQLCIDHGNGHNI